jgi:hypothetical protein
MSLIDIDERHRREAERILKLLREDSPMTGPRILRDANLYYQLKQLKGFPNRYTWLSPRSFR